MTFIQRLPILFLAFSALPANAEWKTSTAVAIYQDYPSGPENNLPAGTIYQPHDFFFNKKGSPMTSRKQALAAGEAELRKGTNFCLGEADRSMGELAASSEFQKICDELYSETPVEKSGIDRFKSKDCRLGFEMRRQEGDKNRYDTYFTVSAAYHGSRLKSGGGSERQDQNKNLKTYVLKKSSEGGNSWEQYHGHEYKKVEHQNFCKLSRSDVAKLRNFSSEAEDLRQCRASYRQAVGDVLQLKQPFLGLDSWHLKTLGLEKTAANGVEILRAIERKNRPGHREVDLSWLRGESQIASMAACRQAMGEVNRQRQFYMGKAEQMSKRHHGNPEFDPNLILDRSEAEGL